MILTPRTLSNPQRCGDYLYALAQKEDWKSFNGLIICSFQEVWGWKTGLFPPILLCWIGFLEYIPIMGFVISCLFQFTSMLAGLLLKCLPFAYNPKLQIAARLREHTPFAYHDNRMPLRCVLDNGLLLLSNHAADRHGAFGFEHHACDDSLAFKGFVYAYFKKQHTLALNTHLQARGDGTERIDQISEITRFIANFRTIIREEMQAKQHCDADCLRNVSRKLKIIACGDWNIDMTEHENMRRRTANMNAKQPSMDTVETGSAQEMEGSVASMCIEIEVKTDDSELNTTIEVEIQRASRTSTRFEMCASYADLPKLFGDSFVKTNGCDPTSPSWGCLDHILANFEFGSFTEEIYGKEAKLSDHFLIKNEFTSFD